jgi:hypothetical protein
VNGRASAEEGQVNVMDQDRVLIGSGIRSSKLLAGADVLASLPNSEVLAITKAG